MLKQYKVSAIVQARMTSSRLPGKVLLPLHNKPVLQHIVERLRRSRYIDDVIVATTTNESDNSIIELCEKLDCKYYRGSEDDVLNRVLEAAREFKTDIIVEITADCPLVCPELVDGCIENIFSHDYVSNVINRTFPRGLDVQVFWSSTLEIANAEVDNPIDRQHVSSWIYKNPKTFKRFELKNIVNMCHRNLSNYRLTLDTLEDYQVLSFIFKAMKYEYFGLIDIENFIEQYADLFEWNQHIPQKSYYMEVMEWYRINTPL